MTNNPLDEIVDDLVVFQHEDPNHPQGKYFSNHPLWNDSRIREHWMARHSDEDDEDLTSNDEVEDYGQWTNDALRTELAARKLDVDGKKADLVKRLEEDDLVNEED